MTPEQLEVEIAELETRMERLRALYEQYFAGIEKIPPSVVRKDVDRRIWQLRHENIRNTGVRFKLQTLIQRYGVYQQYWQRICRDIENGTYKRQLMRSERRSAERAPRLPFGAAGPSPISTRSAAAPPAITEATPTATAASLAQRFTDPPPKGAEDLARYLSRVDVDSAVDRAIDAALEPAPPAKPRASERPRKFRKSSIPPKRSRPVDMLKNLDLELGDFEPPSRPVEKPVARPPPKPARSDGALGRPEAKPTGSKVGAVLPPEQKETRKNRVQELHQELLRAKAKANDSTTVSEQALAASMRVAEEKLRKKHGDKAIDFTVVVKDGKAVLKPVIR